VRVIGSVDVKTLVSRLSPALLMIAIFAHTFGVKGHVCMGTGIYNPLIFFVDFWLNTVLINTSLGRIMSASGYTCTKRLLGSFKCIFFLLNLLLVLTLHIHIFTMHRWDVLKSIVVC
jgi:hypothetical protein